MIAITRALEEAINDGDVIINDIHNNAFVFVRSEGYVDALQNIETELHDLGLDVIFVLGKSKTRVINIHSDQHYDAYIGRKGHGHDGYFGNQHPIGQCAICGVNHNRYESILAFEKDFLLRVKHDPIFKKKVLELSGKILGCFCKPKECHGDIIAHWLNEQTTST